MDAQQLRADLETFCGPSEYSRFVDETVNHGRQQRRFRFWQERLLLRFLDLFPQYRDVTFWEMYTVLAGPQRLTADEYEDYVAAVVSKLDIWKNGTVRRNARFPGQRQPGTYEIDIAIEFTIGEALHFLVIIECKNWDKPVDRPEIQKLIQTRDAIAAHKAAIVSPLGFTKEPERVAKSNGIALWIIGSATKSREGQDGIIGAAHETHGLYMIWEELWRGLCYQLKPFFGDPDAWTTVQFGRKGDAARLRGLDLLVWDKDSQLRNGYFTTYEPHPAFDVSNPNRGYGIDEFFPEFVCAARQQPDENPTKNTLLRWEASTTALLRQIGFNNEATTAMISAVFSDNYRALESWWATQTENRDSWQLGRELYAAYRGSRTR